MDWWIGNRLEEESYLSLSKIVDIFFSENFKYLRVRDHITVEI